MSSEPTTAPTSAASSSWWNAHDARWFVVLGALAVFIWVRDASWLERLDETMPILLALPLFVWFGAPWPRRSDPERVRFAWQAIAGLLLLTGLVSNLTVFLAAGWTTLLVTWLRSRLPADRFHAHRPLFILPAMAFPWIVLDGQAISWWFRLSAAWMTEHLFRAMQFPVTRAGTHLVIHDSPIAVDASCAGLNALQGMLIAGSLVAYVMLGARARLVWLVPLLIGLAWLSNVLRVVLLSGTALTFGHDFAVGWFHATGGWALLFLMFLLCMGLFRGLASVLKE